MEAVFNVIVPEPFPNHRQITPKHPRNVSESAPKSPPHVPERPRTRSWKSCVVNKLETQQQWPPRACWAPKHSHTHLATVLGSMDMEFLRTCFEAWRLITPNPGVVHLLRLLVSLRDSPFGMGTGLIRINGIPTVVTVPRMFEQELQNYMIRTREGDDARIEVYEHYLNQLQ